MMIGRHIGQISEEARTMSLHVRHLAEGRPSKIGLEGSFGNEWRVTQLTSSDVPDIQSRLARAPGLRN